MNYHSNLYSQTYEAYLHSPKHDSQKGFGYDYNNNLFSKNIGSEDFLQAIEKELPPVFTRKTASNIIGGIISVKTMSNLDSLGQGVKGKIKIGSKVGYTRDNFMAWLRCRLQR